MDGGGEARGRIGLNLRTPYNTGLVLFGKSNSLTPMPMLHSCSFPDCDTLTLSAYCFEHDQLIRAEMEAERARPATRDEPVAREFAAVSAVIVQPESPSI
jgi:hypothetical protein